MPGQVQQRVDLGDRHALRPGGDLDDVIPGPHRALTQHPQVKPGPVMGPVHDHQLRSFVIWQD
jgi:hypothetical protein